MFASIQWNAVKATTASKVAAVLPTLEISGDDLHSGKLSEVALCEGGELLAELDAHDLEPTLCERSRGLSRAATDLEDARGWTDVRFRQEVAEQRRRIRWPCTVIEAGYLLECGT